MSSTGRFSRLIGISTGLLSWGFGGPLIKRNGAAMEARNTSDSLFAILRGATPVADNDLTTKQYVDTVNKPVVATAQFNGNAALPANTATEHFYVVTTTGPNATIGQLIFDDGSNVGTAQVIPALDGRSIFTSQAFNGGTISLLGTSYYVWNVASSSWLLESSPQIGGAVREIRYAIGTGATQDSVSKVPANAFVVSAQVEIVTPYSGGATISVGRVGSLALLQATTDNNPQIANTYDVPQDTAWGATALVVRTTIAGAPGAGAGFVIVRYTEPNL